eukprot:1848604-Pleurochrysis_carterae.AAC.1
MHRGNACRRTVECERRACTVRTRDERASVLGPGRRGTWCIFARRHPARIVGRENPEGGVSSVQEEWRPRVPTIRGMFQDVFGPGVTGG